MKNQEVARLFNDIADILDIKGDNPFRIRAYRRAAMNIEGLSQDVAELSREDLMKIPGIGKDLADKILEFVTAGSLGFYEDLKKEVPESLSLLLSIPGLGPKTARLLFDELNVKSIDTLEKLAREHNK